MTISAIGNSIATIVIAGGGGAAVAFGIFRYLGQKWLDDRFASRLEMLRHENAKETERFKLTMSRELDRATKLSAREFEALPEMWAALVDAVATTRSAYARFEQFSDLSRMSDEDATDYLTRIEVPEYHRREILAVPPSDRNRLLSRSRSLSWIHKAGLQIQELDRLVRRSAIFMPTDLNQDFADFVKLTHGALVEIEVSLDGDLRRKEMTDAERLRTDGDDLLKKLEDKVRLRLAALPSETI